MEENLLSDTFGKAVGNLYRGGPTNVSWERALEGLKPDDAARKPEHLPHCVAEIVAHVQFWQAFILTVISGIDPADVQHAAEGWPEPGAWEELKTAFLRDSDALREHARNEAFVQTMDRRGRPYGVALTNFAGHSMYHLGQVVSVRQALGLWPPPSGGDTW